MLHREGNCPLDPQVIADRASRFADVKANGEAFKNVKREPK